MIHILCPHCRHTIALQLVDGDASAPAADRQGDQGSQGDQAGMDGMPGRAGLLGLPELPRRQCQVLSLLSQGFTTKQIAGRLGLHPRTVGLHIRHLKERFHAENIPHLIRLITQPPQTG
jgi:DNA-binding NarL/FixJ family response regulator